MFCLLLVTNSHQSTLLQLGQEDLRVTCQEQPGVADVETDEARAELVNDGEVHTGGHVVHLQPLQSPAAASEHSLQLCVGDVLQDEIPEVGQDPAALQQSAHLQCGCPHVSLVFAGHVLVLGRHVGPHPHLHQGGQAVQPTREDWETTAEVKILDGQRGTITPLAILLRRL